MKNLLKKINIDSFTKKTDNKTGGQNLQKSNGDKKSKKSKKACSCLKFEDGYVCYVLGFSGGKYYLYDKFKVDSLNSLPKKSCKGTMVAIVDAIQEIDIKNLDVPKNAPRSLIDLTLRKEFAEDYTKLAIKYSVEHKISEFDTLYIYPVDKSAVDTMISSSSSDNMNIDIVSSAPFSLLYYTREFIDKTVFHAYIYNRRLFMILSLNNIVYFYRVASITEDEDSVFQNISLTYRYLYTSVKNIDVVLISFSVDKENFISKLSSSFQNSSVVFMDPSKFIHPNGQDEENLFELMLPVAALNVPRNYNFLPEDIIKRKNYNRLAKLFAALLFAGTGLNMINLYLESSKVYYKFVRLEQESAVVNRKISDINNKIKDKDIDSIILMNKMVGEISLQAKAIYKISEFSDLLRTRPFELSIYKLQNSVKVSVKFTEKFADLSSMEKFCNSLPKVANCEKYYETKSVNVLLNFEVSKDGV